MSAAIQLPTQEVLRQLLNYDPATGKLFWRARPVSMFSGSRRGAAGEAAAWNLHHAGKEAFSGLTIMSAQILRFPAKTVDDAWREYCDLVNERADRNLWADLEHNKRIVRAWEEWSKLFLEGEAAK